MKLLKWLFPGGKNGGGDDDKNPKSEEPEGGPPAGNYRPADPNTLIPGETEGLDNSQLGG